MSTPTAKPLRPAKPRGVFREQAPEPAPMTFRPEDDTTQLLERIDSTLSWWAIHRVVHGWPL